MISKSVYHICTTAGVIRVNVSVVLQMALYCELPAGVPNIRSFLSILINATKDPVSFICSQHGLVKKILHP